MITMDVEDTVQVLKLVNYIDKVNVVHTWNNKQPGNH